MKETIRIEGMSCGHCKAAAEKELSNVPGMKSVTVDLEKGTAELEGEYRAEDIKAAVEEAGFTLGQ